FDPGARRPRRQDEVTAPSMNTEGLTIRASRFGPKETADRLAEAVTARGMAVLARIDHAGAAAKVGMTLRPTEVLIFGNTKGGTPLMQAVQTMGIDLPLKALVWEDAAGKTWIGTNDPHWLARRHGIGAESTSTLDAMTKVLDAVAAQAAGD